MKRFCFILLSIALIGFATTYPTAGYAKENAVKISDDVGVDINSVNLDEIWQINAIAVTEAALVSAVYDIMVIPVQVYIPDPMKETIIHNYTYLAYTASPPLCLIFKRGSNI